MGFLRGIMLVTLAALLLSELQSLLVFTVRNYGDFFPNTRTLGWGDGVGLGTLNPQRGPLQVRYLSRL